MRKPTIEETQILTILFTEANLQDHLKDLYVETMDDGDMGSLKLGHNHSMRSFGSASTEYTFKDTDGVIVIATLYLDNKGNPYELDIFKTNFSPTKLLGDKQ
ncbi:MAG TPA: hypothetical protein PLX38_11990 [Gammaproteobacteria bacterium]|nr:hypothetical protein [Xanthomonadales bacterium]MCB1595371.1 hypothetical protein [Xanthomonadales bacterium]HPI96931.1 hypothetical protein [Gammaproteobacteria bacterium]